MKKMLTLAAALVASFSAMAFVPGQSIESVKAEVATRALAGETNEAIAAAAIAAGVAPQVVQSALVAAGRPAAAVFVAVSSVPGVDVASLTAPTAAGPGQTAATAGTGGDFGGGTGGNFSSSPNRSSTAGGGGRSSVSGS